MGPSGAGEEPRHGSGMAAGAAKRITASWVSARADSGGYTWVLATMTAARMREILG